MNQRDIWYVAHPLHQYNEDVMDLARRNNLRVVDANVTKDRSGAAKSPPKLTKKSDKKPAAAAKAD